MSQSLILLFEKKIVNCSNEICTKKKEKGGLIRRQLCGLPWVVDGRVNDGLIRTFLCEAEGNKKSNSVGSVHSEGHQVILGQASRSPVLARFPQELVFGEASCV